MSMELWLDKYIIQLIFSRLLNVQVMHRLLCAFSQLCTMRPLYGQCVLNGTCCDYIGYVFVRHAKMEPFSRWM